MSFFAILIIFALTSNSNASSSDKKCAQVLTPSVPHEFILEQQKKTGDLHPSTKRLQDAVATSGFQNVALNRDVLAKHNSQHTLTLPRGEMVNQYQSGRCWIFAATNMVRSLLLRGQSVDTDFNFSQNYVWFFHFFEQMNTQYERLILARDKKYNAKEQRKLFALRLIEGGNFENFAGIVEQYGIVPYEVMPDTAESVYPENLISELTIEMGRVAVELQKKFNATPRMSDEELRAEKAEFLQRVWQIIATHLGNPPLTFQFKNKDIVMTDPDFKIGIPKIQNAEIKTYTPKEFAAKVARFNGGEWVTFSANPLLPKGKLYELKRNPLEIKRAPRELRFPRRYYNTNTEKLLDLMTRSLQNLIPVWTALDIRQGVDHYTGIMHPNIFNREGLFGPDFVDKPPPNLEDSVRYGITRTVHAVLAIGLDQPKGFDHPIKFKIENSWGKRAGDFGIYHMYREWALEYNLEITIHVSALTDAERALFDKKPVLISEHQDLP